MRVAKPNLQDDTRRTTKPRKYILPELCSSVFISYRWIYYSCFTKTLSAINFSNILSIYLFIIIIIIILVHRASRFCLICSLRTLSTRCLSNKSQVTIPTALVQNLAGNKLYSRIKEHIQLVNEFILQLYYQDGFQVDRMMHMNV